MSGLLQSILGWPWYLQVPVGVLLIGTVLLLLRLLSEGRDVSLGPFKIGARAEKLVGAETGSGPIARPPSGLLASVDPGKAGESHPVAVPMLRVDARPIALLHVDGGQVLVLTEAHRNITLGRSAECDAPINHPSLSRIHLRILVAPEAAAEGKLRAYSVTAVDGGSANGTFVNGRRVDRVDLHDGDIIQAGGVRITFSTVSGAV